MRGLSLLVVLALVGTCVCTLTPTRVILTLAPTSTSMQVTFTTSVLPVKPCVTFWEAASPTNKVQIIATSQDIHTFPHRPTGIDYITTLTMTPLLLGTEYAYYVSGKVGDSSTDSSTFSFFTIPEDNSELRIGIYGDMGAYGAGLMEKGVGGLPYYVQNHSLDFIVHNGDLAYNLGSGNGRKGIEFLMNLETISSAIPYVVTPGNHEFLENSERFYANWFLGQNGLGANSGSPDPLMYYSFNVGLKLHVVVISTEIYCEDRDSLKEQYTWLENDLINIYKRTVKPWIVAFGHRQMYMGVTMSFHGKLMRLGLQCNDSSLQYCEWEPCDSGTNCGYSIERLLNKYNVDMYYAGHIHAYHRMMPIGADGNFETQDKNNYLNPQHPVYIVSGAAGTENAPPSEEPILTANPTASVETWHSFTVLTLFNDTHLKHEQVNISNGNIFDDFWIEKDKKQKPWDKKVPLTLEYDGETECDQ